MDTAIGMKTRMHCDLWPDLTPFRGVSCNIVLQRQPTKVVSIQHVESSTLFCSCGLRARSMRHAPSKLARSQQRKMRFNHWTLAPVVFHDGWERCLLELACTTLTTSPLKFISTCISSSRPSSSPKVWFLDGAVCGMTLAAPVNKVWQMVLKDADHETIDGFAPSTCRRASTCRCVADKEVVSSRKCAEGAKDVPAILHVFLKHLHFVRRILVVIESLLSYS